MQNSPQHTPSAFAQRLASRTQEIRDGFPEPATLTAEARQLLYDALGGMIGHTPLHRIDVESGSTIWAKLESGNPGESHYDRCYLHLLHEMELRGDIIPGETKLLDATSGSAGGSLGWIGRILGYQTQVIIPEELPLARVRALQDTVDEVTISRRHGEYIEGVVQTLREIIKTRANIRLLKEKKLALPNHSRNLSTPAAFESMGREVRAQLPPDVKKLDSVLVMGNGASIKGIEKPLRKRFPQLRVHGVRDAEKSGKITLFGASGADGAGKLPMPFLNPDQYDTVTDVHQSDWLREFEECNKGESEMNTIGRTSAAAFMIAKRLIEKSKERMNILMVVYTHAGRDGDEIVTDPDATYAGNGHWNQK